MKKWLCVFLAGMLLLLLTGCGADNVQLKVVTQTDIAVDLVHLGGLSQGYACVALSDTTDTPFVFVDTDGNYLSEEKYQFAYPFDADKKALVCINDQYAYIDTKGTVTEQASAPAEQGSDYSVFYEKDGKFGLMDADKQPITDAIFDFVGGFSEKDEYVFAEYESDGAYKACLINRQGKQIPLPDGCSRAYVDGEYIHCKLAKDGKTQQTMLDMTGKEVLSSAYDLIKNCDDTYFAIIQDGKLGLLDTKGNVLVTPEIPCDYSQDMVIGYGEEHLTVSINGCVAFVKIMQ